MKKHVCEQNLDETGMCGVCATRVSSSSQSAGSITVDKHFLNALFCAGYRSGHHDTVEGGYTDVLSNDWDTYFDEEVSEILEESNALHESRGED